MKERVATACLAVLFFGLWEGICRLGQVSVLIVPAPSAVLETLVSGLASGYLLPHLWTTTFEMLSGLLIGSVVGFVSGVVLAEIPFVRRVIWPYVIASQVVPKLALAPIFIVWFGFGTTPTIVITALICFFPLLENTLTAIAHTQPSKLELFRMLGASRLQTILRLKIPAGLPVIMAGLRVAVVLSLVGAVVGEFVGGRSGLGATIIAAQGMMDATLMFALFILITVLGLVVYQATLALERWLLRHYQKVSTP